MKFDSMIFAAFFAVVIPLYWMLRTRRSQNLLILAASYLFYGWWDWRFLGLLAASTVIDFAIGRALQASEDETKRRRLVTASLVANLGILAFFKYLDFFTTSFADAFGVDSSSLLVRVVLPVGISFYTFQTLSYTVDVYKRRMDATRDFIAFACYVAFFPQLVAGPIERASRLLPQFARERDLDVGRFRSAVTLMIIGLVKKIVIADNVAPFADMVFGADAEQLSGPLVVAGTLAFTIQIYADFSGYSDIARGVSRLMGFELCVNFNKPYIAFSPSDFWRRWHISLSQWLRDYLYIPLGGNRSSSLFTYRNLMLTMLLGGLWHGASMNFVIWGFYHGLLLCVYRVLRIDRWIANSSAAIRNFVAVPVFFVLTMYGWLLFRADSVMQIKDFSMALLSSWSSWTFALPMLAAVAYFTLPIVISHILARGLRGEKWLPSSPTLWRVMMACVVLYGVVHGRASEQAFIYFQF